MITRTLFSISFRCRRRFTADRRGTSTVEFAVLLPLMLTMYFGAILDLNPVSYNWKTEATGTPPHTGFIAQAVQTIFPDLVSQGPDGYFTLNYAGFAPYIVKAIQSLAAEVTGLEQTVAGFADNFVSAHISVTTLDVGTVTVSNELCAKKTDGTSVCVTNDQLAALLAGTNPTVGNQSPSAPQPGPAATSTPPGSVTWNSPASSTPPTITINGQNPAFIHVDDTYADLGATITGPTADINLGIKTFLNGALVSNIVIDTTQVATDTIDYVATDQSGLTATSTAPWWWSQYRLLQAPSTPWSMFLPPQPRPQQRRPQPRPPPRLGRAPGAPPTVQNS